MATPCDGISECYDNSDEQGCEFSNWLLPSLVVTAVVVLIITCLISMQRNAKNKVNEIMQDRRWRLATQNSTNRNISMASEKLLKVVSYVENCNITAINKLFNMEMEAHGSEATAICCLKVIKNLLFLST